MRAPCWRGSSGGSNSCGGEEEEGGEASRLSAVRGGLAGVHPSPGERLCRGCMRDYGGVVLRNPRIKYVLGSNKNVLSVY